MGCLRIICLVLVVMIFSERSDAVTHNVGDSTGWRVPSETSFYADWADKNVFRVGDQLSFNWTGTHDVAVVTEAQYENCTMVTANVSSSSPVVVNLTALGNYYYICTIDGHCASGQKLEVEVTASNTATPPGSPPPPSGTTNGTAPSAPPPSSASSFGPIGALCAAMSFLVFSFLA